MNTKLAGNSLNGTVKEQHISNISTLVTLISFTMLFATLFLGYALFRLTAETWPPMGMEAVSLGLPALSTAVIFISSITYWLYERNLESGGRSNKYLLATGFFGLLFLGTQTLLWKSLMASGLYASSGVFGSIIFSFTWIHSAHILMGLSALGWLGFKLKRNKATLQTVQNVGKFWHFLGIIWFLMFITIFAI